MAESIGVAGAWRPIAAQWIGVGGAWRPIKAKWISVGGAWRVAYVALTATSSPVTGAATGGAVSGSVQSNLANPTISGGSGSFTYAWTHQSTSSGTTPTINNASSLTPRWTATVNKDIDSVSVWRLTVTDTSYNVTATVDVTVTLDWEQNV